MTGVALAPARRELVLARGALAALAVIAVPVLAGAAASQGLAGLSGAAAGLGLVLVLFGLAGVLHGWAARLPPRAWVAAVAGGFVARLAIYLLALWGLAAVDRLHRPSLAVATAVGFFATLLYELRVLSRTPQLFWVEPGAGDEGGRSRS